MFLSASYKRFKNVTMVAKVVAAPAAAIEEVAMARLFTVVHVSIVIQVGQHSYEIVQPLIVLFKHGLLKSESVVSSTASSCKDGTLPSEAAPLLLPDIMKIPRPRGTNVLMHLRHEQRTAI